MSTAAAPLSHTRASLSPRRGEQLVRGSFLSYIGVLVVLPLAALVAKGLSGGPGALVDAVLTPAALSAVWLTLWTAGVMAAINAVMGLAIAWALVRYNFPFRAFFSALVDLPFAIPTLVTGVMLVILLGPQSLAGMWAESNGFRILFSSPAIVLALLFVCLPFVVRAVEPVLMEQDPAEEEAARTLGASQSRIFFQVLLPPLVPSLVSGTLRSFARALGEFGSVVIVSGNIPHKTLTAPVYLFGEIESGRADVAAAVSIVLLAIALVLVFSARMLERWMGVVHEAP